MPGTLSISLLVPPNAPSFLIYSRGYCRLGAFVLHTCRSPGCASVRTKRGELWLGNVRFLLRTRACAGGGFVPLARRSMRCSGWSCRFASRGRTSGVGIGERATDGPRKFIPPSRSRRGQSGERARRATAIHTSLSLSLTHTHIYIRHTHAGAFSPPLLPPYY